MSWGRYIDWGLGFAGSKSSGVAAPAPSVVFVSSGAAVSGVGALNPLAPVHQAGDVLLLVIGNSLTNTVPTLTTASGYSAIVTGQSTHDFGGGATFMNIRAWELRCDQTTMNSNGGQMPLPVVGDGGDLNMARIFLFRPNTTLVGSAVEVSATTQNNTYNTPVAFASVTTVGTNRMIVLIQGAITASSPITQNTVVNANLSSIVEQSDETFTGGGTFQTLAVVTATAAATGAIGASSAALSGNGVITTLTIALKP